MSKQNGAWALAANRLIREHEWLIKHLSRRYSRVGRRAGPDERMQAGRIGLWKALRGFDSSRGVKFASYATQFVLAEFRRAGRDVIPLAGVALDDEIAIDPRASAADELERLATLDAVLERLSPRQRAVALAIYRDGLSAADTARGLGMSRARVGQLLERIHSRGRELIAA
jgi:RNA polymerase sigma factor (sigma-70 family)